MAPCGRVRARSRRGPGPLPFLLLLLGALGPARAEQGGAAVGFPAAVAAVQAQQQQQQQQGPGPGPQQPPQPGLLGVAPAGGLGVIRGPRAGGPSAGGGGTWKLAEEPYCREDVTRVCPKHSWANNLAVLECLQDVREVRRLGAFRWRLWLPARLAWGSLPGRG